MKTYLKALILIVALLPMTTVKSQVLISLLFGDKLNTPNIEFGLVGGWNYSYMLDIQDSDPMNNFNLGFYFHILLKKNSYLSTGVLVKSNMGAQGMPTYSRDNPDFDELYKDGTLTKQVNYFYVPILFQQRFNDNRWYAEAGLQLGLRSKAYDYFNVEAAGGNLEYELDVRDQYSHFDGGLLGGFGYKFHKSIKSMAVGVNYYYGLKNISLTDTEIKNSAIYVYMKIPIGLGAKPADDE